MAEKHARVERVEVLAPEVRLVTCRPIDPPAIDFQPAQFVSVRCAGGGDTRRSYTILSSPARRDSFELLVKDVPGGVGTAYFSGLAPGDELAFTGPMGFFTPQPSHAGAVVIVATGAGVAGALPIAEAVVARGERARLDWALLDGQPTYLVDRLDALVGPSFAWHLHRAPTWPDAHATLEREALDVLAAERAADAPPSFYLVGNGDMCRRVRDALIARGVDRRKAIHQEQFYPVDEGHAR
jgi:ferredoxin-NADP reductase